MQKTIAYDALPYGIALYNGIQVAEITTFDEGPEEVLLASTLPAWAKETIKEYPHGSVHMNRSGQNLQISARSILYNNKKVTNDL